MRSLLGAGAVLAVMVLTACGDDAEPDPGPGFDPSNVFETFEHGVVHRDEPFAFERATLFRTDAQLEDLHVTELALLGGDIFVSTLGGLHRLAGEAFEPVDSLPRSPLYAMAVDGDTLLVVGESSVHRVSRDGSVQQTWTRTSTQPATAVVSVSGVPLVGGASGLEALGDTAIPPLEAEVRSLLIAGEELWVGTSNGLQRFVASSGAELEPIRAPNLLPDDDVRALALGDGEVVVASATGLTHIDLASMDARRIEVGIDGLPNGDLRALAVEGDAVLVGASIGATMLDGERKDHYHTERWIPDETVTAVALAKDGTRWIGTSAGLSRIRLEPWTLTQKAELFEDMIEEHVRMDGFVSVDAFYADAWNPDSKTALRDNDNDGQWTETQLGAWCFAYAATGEQRYYDKARRTFEVMSMLFDLPAQTFESQGLSRGFISRSLVRDDEGEVFDSKSTQDNWHPVDYEGRSYYWKDNTSPDEYDGHFFGLPLYYDLCAQDEAERAETRERLRSAMDYLIAHDYQLIDIDGEQTSDGRWNNLAIAVDGLDSCVDRHGLENAESCIFSRHGGGWLNSIEILGYLLATWHVTGDAKYYDEYERLHTEERYGELIPITEDTFTVTEPSFANHSDHEMAVLAYHTLLRYEPNEDRRERWVQSFRSFVEYEAAERNPFTIAGFASVDSADPGLDDAIRTLSEMPTDLRAWRYDNSHRLDAKRDVVDRFGQPQFKTVFPYDEIRSALWNASPYEMVGGSSGEARVVPMPYLISYWMLRYYGLIEAP